MLSSSISPDNSVSVRRLISTPPIFYLSIVFSIGIWQTTVILFPFFSIALFTSFVLLASLVYHKNRLFIPLSLLLFFAIGILFGTNNRAISDRDITLNTSEGNMILEGLVVTVPEMTVKGKKETVSFVLDAYDFFRKGRSHKIEGKVQVFLHNPGRNIHFGDQLRLKGVLEIPKESRNPYAFDYAAYLARNGIMEVFRGIGRFSVVHQTEGKGNKLFLHLNRFRAFLETRIEQLFPSPYHELASALILGFRKNIPRDIQDAFIKTGTAHLVAISGLNISLVGGLFYFLMSFLRLPRILNLGLTVVFIAFYTILAGASAPVLRAGIMGIVVLLGFLLGQERDLRSALFFSYFLLLTCEPGSLFTASFQLSFVAVASLIFLLPKLEEMIHLQTLEIEKNFALLLQGKRPHLIGGLIRLRYSIFQTLLSSFAVTVGMFPILIWYFNLFSVVGFLANIIAIPVCNLAIALTFALLVISLPFPSLACVLNFPVLIFYRFELWLIDWFSKFPAGYFYIQKPNLFFFMVYYGSLMAWLFLLDWRKWPLARRACPVVMSLATGIFLIGSFPARSSFTFFDLGKTESAFVAFSNGANCLINAGRHFPSDQAYWVLRPFFMASGVHKLDSVLFTKVDGWHAGGFKTLTHHIKIKNVLARAESKKTNAWSKYLASERFNKWSLHTVSAGDRIQFGSANVYIQILAVSADKILAFEMVDGKDKMLFLASVKDETFQALSQFDDYCDFVFLPHHEFGLSEIEKVFLKKLAPRFIILNQRDQTTEFRTKLKFLAGSNLLFLQDSGAIEFYRSRGFWNYRTFLNASDGTTSAKRLYLAS